MNFFKKLNKTDILLILVLLMMGYLVFKPTETEKTDMSGLNQQMSDINKKIDQYYAENDSIYRQLSVIDSKVGGIERNITTVNKTITKIKTETNEQINRVDDYTFSDLEKFFADRYKEK